MLKILVLMFLLCSVICVERAMACSCAVNGTVDAEFAATPNVVIMKLRSVEKYQAGESGYGYGGIKEARLTVETVFKGNLKAGQQMTFAQGGGADCIWTFGEDGIGNEYLLYLGAKPAKADLWVAGTCSRSGSLKYAAADLLYLANFKKVAGKTRLSGTLTQRIESSVEEQPSSTEILAGRKVYISGNGKTIELKTDKNGVYEVYDLAPGKYRIRPERIPGFNPYGSEQDDGTQIQIDPKDHTERNFDFVIDNAIRGRFFDANGKPLKDVCLDLIPARGTKAQYFYSSDCTNADGSFELKEIPSGSYVILFNDDGKVTAATPFGAFYYPNVKLREEAAELQVAPGTVIDNLTIVAPETADVIAVSGVLKLEDGKTANKENAEYAAVEFIAENTDEKADEDEPTSRATIGENGRFTIRILKGQKGRLYGTMSTYPGAYINCPKLEKLIPKKEGINIIDIKTASIFINAENDQTDVELKFPFPSCKRARID